MKRRPVIAMTMGDPAGVGPEVCLKAALEASVRKKCLPLIVGDMAIIQQARPEDGDSGPTGHVVKDERSACAISRIGPHASDRSKKRRSRTPCISEKSSPNWAKRRAGTSKKPSRWCSAGWADAVATAPINKESLQAGGYDYPGHTEMLAALCGERAARHDAGAPQDTHRALYRPIVLFRVALQARQAKKNRLRGSSSGRRPAPAGSASNPESVSRA